MRNTPSLGTPIKSELKRNCLFCNRYSLCKDERKSGRFACSKFKENQSFDIDNLIGKLDSKEIKEVSEEDIIEDNLLIDDFVTRMDEVLNSNLPVIPDLTYDDRHIPRAKNVFEWMTKDKFLGLDDIKPYAKQLQLVCNTQGDWCPHCSNEDFFEDFPLNATYDDIKDNVTFLNNGVCPKCKTTKYDLIYGNSNQRVDSYADPFGLFAVVGQRAGKTTIVAMNESYSLHKWLSLPSPHKVFKQARATPFVATYVALTFVHAKNNLWAPVLGFIEASPWFKNYHKWLDIEGKRVGEELYKFSETMFKYNHKNYAATIATPSKRVLRGATRFSAVVDELGLYPIGKTKAGQDHERLNGKEVVTSLTNSLMTLKGAYLARLKQGYYDLPKTCFSAVSSPMALNDAIMQQYRTHVGSKDYYCIKYATWEFNPNLPRETFDTNFRTNPVEAERDYGANPPVTTGAFLPKEKEVFSVFSSKTNRVEIEPKKVKTKNKNILSTGVIKKFFPIDNIIDSGCLLVIDPGLNNNSFAFAVGGFYDETFKIIALGEIIPRIDNPVSFRRVTEDILKPIIEEFNVLFVASDRWQNVKLMQDLEEETGITYEEVRLKYKDFLSYKEDIREGSIKLPKMTMSLEDIMQVTTDQYPDVFKLKPVDHCFYQHVTVIDSGNTISKGIITDDLFRCCVLANTIRKYDYIEESLKEEGQDDNILKPVNVVLKKMSGGANSAKSSSLATRLSYKK